MSLLLHALRARHPADEDLSGERIAGSTSEHRARAASVDASRQIERLETRVETLSLLVLALAETLKARAGATDEEILKQVTLLDLKDGAADGRLAGAAKKCRDCSRTVAARHKLCLFCGGEALSDLPPGSVEALLR